MWSAINTNSQNSKRLSNLKQLKLVPVQSNPSPINTDPPSTTDPNAMPALWRKELRLSTAVERQRKKLSTSTSSTSTTYSHASSRVPPTPFDLPRIDHRLSDLDEKLEVIENMMSARQQMFEVLSKDSSMLNSDLQKDLQRYSQSFQSSKSKSSSSKASDEGTPPGTLPDEPASAPAETSKGPQAESTQPPATSDNSNGTSGAAVGWGEYLKKWW